MFLEIYLVDGGGGKSEGVVQRVKVSLHTALAVTQCVSNSQPWNNIIQFIKIQMNAL